MDCNENSFHDCNVKIAPTTIRDSQFIVPVPLERRCYSRRNSDKITLIQLMPINQWDCHRDTKGCIQLIIDKKRRVLHSSENTDSFLNDFDKLIDISSKLTLYSIDLSTQLFVFLNQKEFINKSCELLLRGENIRQILVLNCSPLLTHQSIQPPNKFFISLRNPFYVQQEKWTLFTKTYELTHAESKLCKAFLYGISITDYCHERKISQSTVRSQLSSIFLKTATSKQSDLSRLIYSYLFL